MIQAKTVGTQFLPCLSEVWKKKWKKSCNYPFQVHSSFSGILELHDANSVIMSFLRAFTVKVNSYFTRGFASIWYVIKNLYIMTNSVNNSSIYSYHMKFKDL